MEPAGETTFPSRGAHFAHAVGVQLKSQTMPQQHAKMLEVVAARLMLPK